MSIAPPDPPVRRAELGDARHVPNGQHPHLGYNKVATQEKRHQITPSVWCRFHFFALMKFKPRHYSISSILVTIDQSMANLRIAAV